MIINDLAVWNDLLQDEISDKISGGFNAYSISVGHAISYAYAEGWNTKTSTSIRVQVSSKTTATEAITREKVNSIEIPSFNKFWN